ncbi:MAG: hypothetical protein ACSHX6_10105 [Akkermansiaceae bacterium]
MSVDFVDFSIYWAGFVLGMIIVANFIAPKKLGYERNLVKMEPFIAEVFRVHCGYTVLTMFGMLLACVFYTAELRVGEGVAFGVNLFMALFWGSRVVVQVFFYDKEIKKKYPVFNVLFFTAFAYLAVVFTFLTIK